MACAARCLVSTVGNPVSRHAEKASGQRLVDCLAFHCVAGISENPEQDHRQEQNHTKADPVLIDRIFALDVAKLGGEVTSHQTDW